MDLDTEHRRVLINRSFGSHRAFGATAEIYLGKIAIC